MRGKAPVQSIPALHSGITPAYAGKRVPVRHGCARRGDHPRVCGEKAIATRCAPTGTESPPRMRGKEGRQRDGQHHQRITPACAGKRSPSRPTAFCVQNHPRMCGEKLYPLPCFQRQLGSPPHVRGKAVIGGLIGLGVGITPACAGKSNCPGNGRFAVGDHPRMCGEKPKKIP